MPKNTSVMKCVACGSKSNLSWIPSRIGNEIVALIITCDLCIGKVVGSDLILLPKKTKPNVKQETKH